MYPNVLRANPPPCFFKGSIRGDWGGGEAPPGTTSEMLESYCSFPLQSTMWAVLGDPLRGPLGGEGVSLERLGGPREVPGGPGGTLEKVLFWFDWV